MTQTNELRILEEDMGADAITFTNNNEGVTYLFIRPGQSFESAVKGILRVCPEMTLPRVQDLVRTHCPNIIEMNERLGSDQNVPRFEAAPAAGVVAPNPVQATGTHRRLRVSRWARIAAVAVPAVAGGVMVAQLLQPSGTGPATSVLPPGPSANQEDKALAGTYKDPEFKKIAEGGRMTCDPMGPYEAKCVDADGKVMLSEASVGTSSAFTFSYDFEKIGFRIFPDEEAAAAWSAEEGNQNLYRNIRRHGRVVLWGTDEKRLGAWEQSLVQDATETRKARHAALMGGPRPVVFSPAALPDRLAFLAFGTLGVTEESVRHAVRTDDTGSVQLLRAVELVLGYAQSSPSGIVPSGPNDAVAIVLDATHHEGKDSVTEPVHTGDAALRPAPPEVVFPATTPPPAEVPTPKPEVTPPAPETPGGPTTRTPEPNPEVKPDPEPEQPTTPEPEPEPKDPGTPEAKPEPEPEPKDPGTPEAKPEPELPTTPDLDTKPGPEEPRTPEPGPEQTVTPQPETPPAPPVEEEPESDGPSLAALPSAEAA
ncbi:hypothetical protein EF903_05345 [Streptomyces sp. WAC05292]|nr:hypothetical protein [Streptomyces sp. WAC05292]RSS95066.1 hypothetical protein EF903_05345 [Streptomyces sp. WAC05292]